MDNDRELKFIFLYLNLIAFIIGVMIFAILTFNKLDAINERLDAIEAEMGVDDAE